MDARDDLERWAMLLEKKRGEVAVGVHQIKVGA